MLRVAGAPRAVPCGALPRRVRPRTPARLTGADWAAPAPFTEDRRPLGGRHDQKSAYPTMHVAAELLLVISRQIICHGFVRGMFFV